MASLLVVGGLLVGALLSEVGLRVYVALDPHLGSRLLANDPLAVLVEPVGELGYRQRPGARFRYVTGATATANRMGYRGPEVTPAKPPGVYRIVLLGGSTTHGWGVTDDETIDAHMRRILARSRPGQRYEVVNLAFDGYDSYQLLQRFVNDGLALAPDLVVINCGINDVRNARIPNLQDQDPRTVLWEGVLRRLREERQRGRPTVPTLVKHYSLVARLPGFIRQEVAWAIEAAAEPPDTGYPEAADYLERSLRRIAAAAEVSGIALLLVTPPSALRITYDPTARSSLSYWLRTAEATARHRDTLATRMRSVAAGLRAAGRPAAYLRRDLPAAMFLDDAHLTSDGNRRVAEALVSAALRLRDGRP